VRIYFDAVLSWTSFIYVYVCFCYLILTPTHDVGEDALAIGRGGACPVVSHLTSEREKTRKTVQSSVLLLRLGHGQQHAQVRSRSRG
jgi:hypothetical protein